MTTAVATEPADQREKFRRQRHKDRAKTKAAPPLPDARPAVTPAFHHKPPRRPRMAMLAEADLRIYFGDYHSRLGIRSAVHYERVQQYTFRDGKKGGTMDRPTTCELVMIEHTDGGGGRFADQDRRVSDVAMKLRRVESRMKRLTKADRDVLACMFGPLASEPPEQPVEKGFVPGAPRTALELAFPAFGDYAPIVCLCPAAHRAWREYGPRQKMDDWLSSMNRNWLKGTSRMSERDQLLVSGISNDADQLFRRAIRAYEVA